jgi:tetratricopeptide (TPR) repeat protein
MNKLPQRTLLIIIICYLTAFIYLFSFSIFSFASINIVGKTITNTEEHGLNMEISISRDKPESEIQILSNFKISWILSNSLRLFIQFLLPINSTALIISFSLIFPWRLGQRGLQIPFVDVIGKCIIIFLILTLFFAGLTEGVLPRVLKKQAEQQYLTDMAVIYFEKAESEISVDNNEKNYSVIVNMLRGYLQIDPDNPVIIDTHNWAESALDIVTSEIDSINPIISIDSTTDSNGDKSADFILKAKDYFLNEDYFSALYYSNLAFKLDDSRQEAQRIAAESRDAIRSLEPDKSEREAKEYFQLKRTGFNALNDGNPIEAYYIFKELTGHSTEDKDIAEFLERSLNDISDKSFFIDEAEKYSTRPGIENITFLNDSKTLISFGKIILLNENEAYFFDIEVIQFDNNKITRHYKAPYGKYYSNSKSIIMQAIDRDHVNISIKPTYFTGTDKEPDNIILKLSPEIIDFKYLGQSVNTIKFMNILELFNYGSIFYKYGYIKEPIQILLLERILKPFTFLIVSFLSVSIGWFLRSRNYSFPWFALLLIPVITYLIDNIISLYEYGMALVLAFSLFKTGFYTALIILIISQAIIFFFSLVSIAAQKD